MKRGDIKEKSQTAKNVKKVIKQTNIAMGCPPAKIPQKEYQKRQGERITEDDVDKFKVLRVYLQEDRVIILDMNWKEAQLLTYKLGEFANTNPASAQIANRLYLCGGSQDQMPITRCALYLVNIQFQIEEGRYIASLPIAKAQFTLVPVGLTHLFSLGGKSETQCLSSCERYDVNADGWEIVAPLNTAKRDLAACAYQNAWIYVFGGMTDTGPSIHIECLELKDLIHARWLSLNVPAPNIDVAFTSARCIQYENNIMICGSPICLLYEVEKKVLQAPKVSNLPPEMFPLKYITTYNTELYVLNESSLLAWHAIGNNVWNTKQLIVRREGRDLSRFVPIKKPS